MPDAFIDLIRRLPGVVETLQAGADVLAVGYRTRGALTRAARAFPRSCFTVLGARPSPLPPRARGRNLRFLPGLDALAPEAEFDVVAAGGRVTTDEFAALNALLKPGGVLLGREGSRHLRAEHGGKR